MQRISGLANAAQRGQLLPDGSGWLDSPHQYSFQSTVYSLLAPITTFSILQRRMTTIDLGLDRGVRAKYELLKLIFFSFRNDWSLAAGVGEETRLDYDRNKTDPGEPDRERLLRSSPQRYAPQGLYRVMIYVVADAFIATPRASSAANGSEAGERCMTFGEFQRAWDRARSDRGPSLAGKLGRIARPREQQSPMTPVYGTLVELFAGFHPQRKPVLWRLLLAQYLLYGALLREKPKLAPLTEKEIEAIKWCGERSDEAEFRRSLQVAEGFVGEQLAELRTRLKQG